MIIARWSPRTIVWLWIGLLGCYVIIIGIGAIRNERARRAFELSMSVSPTTADTSRLRISPAQLARRDSLVDSLKRLGRNFLDSPDGKAMVRGISVAWTETSRELMGVIILVFALLLAPAVVMTILTVVWFTRRRAELRRAGA